MNASTVSVPVDFPEGAELLQSGGGDGTGNRLLLFRDEGLLLKLYRTRGSVGREQLRSLSHRLFERRRGASARERCASERASLDRAAPRQRAVPPG